MCWSTKNESQYAKHVCRILQMETQQLPTYFHWTFEVAHWTGFRGHIVKIALHLVKSALELVKNSKLEV